MLTGKERALYLELTSKSKETFKSIENDIQKNYSSWWSQLVLSMISVSPQARPKASGVYQIVKDYSDQLQKKQNVQQNVQQPVYQPKIVQQPVYTVPKTQPVYQQIKIDQPKVEQPKIEQPKIELPKIEVKIEQPKIEPKKEQKVEQPKIEPKTEQKVEPKKETKKDFAYVSELVLLAEMGFTDIELSMELLRKFKGDINQVVRAILE